MFLKKIKNIIPKKNKNLLRNKFLEIENRAEKINLQKQEANNIQLEKSIIETKKVETFIFEEEVLWWEDKNQFDEKVDSDILVTDFGDALVKFRKSELNMLVGKNETLKIETITNATSYLLITWASDYLNLSLRRRTLDLIKQFRDEIKTYGLSLELVHNHKRIGISNNLGVKIIMEQMPGKVTEIVANSDGDTVL